MRGADKSNQRATACPPPSTLLWFPDLDGSLPPLMTTGGQTVSAAKVVVVPEYFLG